MIFCHLHPEEGDAGEKIYRRFQVAESSLVAGWEVILQTKTHSISGYHILSNIKTNFLSFL